MLSHHGPATLVRGERLSGASHALIGVHQPQMQNLRYGIYFERPVVERASVGRAARYHHDVGGRTELLDEPELYSFARPSAPRRLGLACQKLALIKT
jgi:hypothetical protein